MRRRSSMSEAWETSQSSCTRAFRHLQQHVNVREPSYLPDTEFLLYLIESHAKRVRSVLDTHAPIACPMLPLLRRSHLRDSDGPSGHHRQ
jgi:hypothetical protein